MKGLVILRQDIRLDDNPAFKNAFEENQEVHALYIYSLDQLKSHNESDIKISFLIENIKLLDAELDKLNVGLSIIKTNGFESDPLEILSFFEEHNFDTLYFNNTFGEDENSRDVKIKNYLMNAATLIKHLQIRFYLSLVQLELLRINHILFSHHLKGSGLRILILICLILSTNIPLKIKKF